MVQPFAPPIAFAVYFALAAILLVVAGASAARGKASELKSSIYGSGEAAGAGSASPGYRPFFMTAFFFAMLHLGVLIVGSGGLTIVTGVYLTGLLLSLIALALG
jgi:NADH:ubiquinone oxidoreductase subunit 3 (subunit A)